MIQFLRTYLGFTIAYLTYRTSFYTLETFFRMVDEIADIQDNTPNNTKELSPSDDWIDKRTVNNTDLRGGQNEGDLTIGIKKPFSSVTEISNKANKALSKSLKPVAGIIGKLIKRSAIAKKIYKTIKAIKTAIAATVGFAGLRIVARFDYWALIICDGLPIISADQKAVLASIRRMRMGLEGIHVCLPQTNDVLSLLTDDEVSLKRKDKAVIDILTLYEMLPENHIFKNPYFACIVHCLLTLFILNKLSFRLALRVLLRLLNSGKISLKTYREIIAQLIIGGISPLEVEA